MKFEIQVSTTVELEFNEHSGEFRQLFEAFNENIFKCTHEEFAAYIAEFIARYGVDEQIEAVGYLQVDGENQIVPTVKVNKDGKKHLEYVEYPGYVNIIDPDMDINRKLIFHTDYIAET